MFYLWKYYRKNVEESEKIYAKKEQDFFTAKEKLSEAEHKVKLGIEAFEKKDEELTETKSKISELEKSLKFTSTCSEFSPEIASAVEYLTQNNKTTLYSSGMHMWFLLNIWQDRVPAHSHLWHPQTTKDVFTAQSFLYFIYVVFSLLGRVIDGFITKIFARKYQLHLTRWSKVKMTSFYSFLAFKLKNLFRQLFTTTNFSK